MSAYGCASGSNARGSRGRMGGSPTPAAASCSPRPSRATPRRRRNARGKLRRSRARRRSPASASVRAQARNAVRRQPRPTARRSFTDRSRWLHRALCPSPRDSEFRFFSGSAWQPSAQRCLACCRHPLPHRRSDARHELHGRKYGPGKQCGRVDPAGRRWSVPADLDDKLSGKRRHLRQFRLECRLHVRNLRRRPG